MHSSCPTAVPPVPSDSDLPPPVMPPVNLSDGHDLAARLAGNPGGMPTVLKRSGVTGAFGARQR